MSLIGDNRPATAARQDAGNATLTQIKDKIIAAPATEAKQDALILRVGEVTAAPVATSLLGRLKAIADTLALPLTVAAHAVTQSGVWVLSAGNAIIGKVGIDPAANSVVAAPSTDQDPIFDEANGIRVATGGSASVFMPAVGCKFARFDATVDTFIRTDNVVAADTAGATRLVADQPEIIPVTAGVAVRAYSATAGVLRITPLKVR